MGGWLIPPFVYLVTSAGYAPQTVLVGLIVFGSATAYVVMIRTKGVRRRIRDMKQKELEEITRKIVDIAAHSPRYTAKKRSRNS